MDGRIVEGFEMLAGFGQVNIRRLIEHWIGRQVRQNDRGFENVGLAVAFRIRGLRLVLWSLMAATVGGRRVGDGLPCECQARHAAGTENCDQQQRQRRLGGCGQHDSFSLQRSTSIWSANLEMLQIRIGVPAEMHRVGHLTHLDYGRVARVVR